MDADGLSHRVFISGAGLLEEDLPDFDLSVGYDVHREIVTTRFSERDDPASTMGEGETEDADRGEDTTFPETTPLSPKPSNRAELAAGVLSKLRLPFYSSSQISCFSIILLCILLSIYVVNQADRLVLPVVIPAGLRCGAGNKSDACVQLPLNQSTFLNVSSDADKRTVQESSSCIEFNDWEQGLLTGPAFTVIYVLAGLPLAYLADWKSRPLVLILGLAFWSLVVLLTSFTETFWELLLLRIFLGIGEVCWEVGGVCVPRLSEPFPATAALSTPLPCRHRAIL